MAGTDVKVQLDVQDKGSIKSLTNETKALNKELETAQKLATGTKTGASAVKASMSPKAARYAEITEYGQARGSTGRTGASARDFANEAQGLGGLVRLYATYAANVFAASMAFNALREAMNTDNMVKGLDQLGAASGVAMGSLARDFAKASGGAISLRESMEATAKAMSSGMSSKQFLELGEVAKKASQALGVNMADAVSRLTRGITKLEPELLDELGLFTRVDQAAKEYAKSLGRSEASLNSFERRMAFANAVLAEGKQKFNEIQIDTNPYDLLLAKLKDTTQQILSVINTVLAPVAKIFAENTELIAAAIGLLTMKLFSQVVPVIGHYREAMKKAAEDAKNFAEDRARAAAASAKRIQEAKAAEIKAVKDAAAAAKDAKVAEAQQNLDDISKGKLSKKTRTILDEKRPIQDITNEELAYLDKLASKNTMLSGTYGQLANAIREAKKANEEYVVAAKAADERASKPPKYFSQAAANMRAAEKARQVYASKSIVSNTAETAAIEGSAAAWKKLNESIKTEKLTAARAGMTRLAGGAAILGNAITGVASAISTAFFYVGVFVAAFQVLDGLMSRNSKEMGVFNDSIQTLSSGLDAATLTAKKYGEELTPDSLQAKATALQNISDSLIAVAEAAEAASDKSSAWDRGIDNIKDVFGYGMTDKLGEQASKAVETTSKMLSDPKLKKALQLRITAMVGDKSLEDYFDDLDVNEAVKKFKEIKDVVKELNAENVKSAGTFADAVSSIKSVADATKELEKGFKGASDPMSKLGVELVNSSNRWAAALKEPTTVLTGITQLLKNPDSLKAFGPELYTNITEAKTRLTEYQAELDKVNRLIAAGKALQKTPSPELRAQGTAMEAANLPRKAELENLIKGVFSSLEAGFNASMERGLRLIEQPLTNAVASAGNKLASTVASFLPKTTGSIAVEASLERQAIDIQIKNITAQYELNNSLKILTLVMEKDAKERAASEKAKEALASGDRELYNLIRKNPDPEIKRLEKDIQVLRSGNFKGISREDWTPATTEAYAASVSNQAAIAGLVGQKAASIVSEKMKTFNQVTDTLLKEQETAISNARKISEAFFKTDEFNNMSQNDRETYKTGVSTALDAASREVDITKIEREQEYLRVLKEVVTTTNIGGENQSKMLSAISERATQLKEQLAVQKEVNKLTTEGAIQASNREESERQILEAFKLRSIELEKATAIENRSAANVSLAQQLASIDLDRAKYLQSINLLSNDEYNIKEKLAQSSKINSDRDIRINSIKLQQAKLQLQYEERIAAVKNNPGLVAKLKEMQELEMGNLNAQISATNTLADAQLKSLELTYSMTDRQKAYSDIFVKSIDNMADAMTEFVKTGKLDFKSLIESMLADLLRYEMRLQFMSIYQNMGGGLGILGSILGALGGGGSGTVGEGFISNSMTQSQMLASQTAGMFANGGAFDSGVQAFAKGGTFTNTIVSSPTTFKFAKGTGLMGEAGPEAIMPLQRGTDGSLGVRATTSQPKVNISIINNTSEKAETKESVDSRGNRSVEVVIGEMVAGEMSKPNSAVQNTMRNTYGTSPMLTRR